MKRAMLAIAMLVGLSGCLGGEETDQPCADAGQTDAGRQYNLAIVCSMMSKYQTREPDVPCPPACRDVVDQAAGVACQCPGGGDNCSPGSLVWQSVNDGGVDQ